MDFALTPVRGEIRLGSIDPEFDAGLDKDQGEELLKQVGKELSDLLDLLFFAGQHSLLVVLQGRDTSGKDGTIRRILSFANAQSCSVSSFKVPTPKELAHDFLWRVHHETPGRGESKIFNRSHYEDVLVVRVHDLVPKEVWAKRYGAINAFEELLVEANTIVVKFCLHISKDEQEQRLLDREKEVEKAWKLSAGDWKEREHWDKYTEAYEAVLSKCSPEHAPWYVVPSNKKWFRDLAIVSTLVKTLRDHVPSWMQRLEKIGAEAKAELAEYRASLP
ncbi:MAG TPA: hypothetical protein PKA27_07885 [Fimbriimonadaceae bacterium]|nr:hypothetical protein [Fimbriimonadaceae bacterium]